MDKRRGVERRSDRTHCYKMIKEFAMTRFKKYFGKKKPVEVEPVKVFIRKDIIEFLKKDGYEKDLDGKYRKGLVSFHPSMEKIKTVSLNPTADKSYDFWCPETHYSYKREWLVFPEEKEFETFISNLFNPINNCYRPEHIPDNPSIDLKSINQKLNKQIDEIKKDFRKKKIEFLFLRTSNLQNLEKIEELEEKLVKIEQEYLEMKVYKK